MTDLLETDLVAVATNRAFRAPKLYFVWES